MAESIPDLTNLPEDRDVMAFLRDLSSEAREILAHFLKACPAAAVNLLKAIGFEKARANMEALRNKLSSEAESSMVQVLEYCKKCELFKYFDKETQERLSQNVLTEAETMKLLRDGIAQAERNMANSFLKACAASSVCAAVLQAVKLYTIWGHIKDAKNCYMDTNARATISENMDKIVAEIAKMEMTMKKLDQEDNKSNVLLDLEEDLLDLVQVIDETKELIGKIEVEIKGKRQVLITDSAAMDLDIIGNFFQLGTNLFQFYNGAGLASTGYKVATGMAIGVHAAATVGTVVIKILTEKEIKICKREMDAMAGLGREIKKYKEQSVAIQKWVIRKKRDLSENC